MFGRRQYLVNSRDRATGTATNFLYRLPNQMRDVVHVNLLHCIVENGVFNVDDTNNKFMLNQQSNNLTDGLGNLNYSDFPYLANQVLAYSYLGSAPTFFGVGKGGGALLWCEPTLQNTEPIQLEWKIKQPFQSGPAWNNNIGNATELMCIASNKSTDGNTIVVGGNNLVSQGHQTNFAICTNPSLGGEACTFDTSLATGGPSKSVNGVAYVEVETASYWICTGDDSLRTTPNGIKIDDTNNQIRINVVDLNQDSFWLTSGLTIQVWVVGLGSLGLAKIIDIVMPSGYYTKLTFSTQFDAIVNTAFNDGTYLSYGVVQNIKSSFDPNNNFVITATGLNNGKPDPIFTCIQGTLLQVMGLPAPSDNGSTFYYPAIGVINSKFNNPTVTQADMSSVRWITSMSGQISFDYPQLTLFVATGIAEQTLSATFPSGNFTPVEFASQLASTLNTTINSVPLLAGRNVDLLFSYDSESDMFAYSDNTANHPFDIILKQSGEFQTPVTIAFGKIIGLDETDLYFGVDSSNTQVGYNLVVPFSTWYSSDGYQWTSIKDSALQNVVGNCVSIVNNLNTGPAIIIGTDDGVVYNNGANLTSAWTKLGNSTQLSGTNFGKVYAVESVVDGSDGIVVAIGCLGGQVYYSDNFWGTQPPEINLLTTLLRSPNDYDPVCNSIKFTGVTDGIQPTWIFAGSSMSYITAVDNFLTGKTLSIVQFNSGPAQDPANYPYLEYINGIETVTVNDGGDLTLYTCLVGDNMGQYSCSDITSSSELNSWTGVQPFANNILIQIPVGYYTNTSLASAVAELLNNQVLTGNGTFYTEVQADGTFVIANTTSGNWGIRFMNGTLTYEGTAALLGFENITKQYEPSVLQGQEGPYTVKSDVEGGLDLTPFEYVLVQSDKFGNDLMTNSGLSCWWLVPNVANGVNANSIVYENTRNPTLEYLQNPRDIEQFDIRVLNSNGEILELQDNKNVVIVIEFYTKKAGCR